MSEQPDFKPLLTPKQRIMFGFFVWSMALVMWIPTAYISPIDFENLGSQEDPMIWLGLIVFASFPFTTAICLRKAMIAFKLRQQFGSVLFVPLVHPILFFFFMALVRSTD